MGLRFTVLGSSSSGNATLVSDGQHNILVDVGLSGREAARRVAQCGITPDRISAIVVSHEHGDHCRGVSPFVKSLEIPTFVTESAFDTWGVSLDPRKRQQIESGVPFELYGMVFTPFPVSHDAADPISFTIEKDGIKIAIVLDLGYISNLVIERLRKCDGIVLESNHDINMLKVGPYPWALKQRVLSRRGHLSNANVAEYLAAGFDGQARHLVLAHLSKKNNLPELALLSARQALEGRSGLRCTQTRLALATADSISETFCY